MEACLGSVANFHAHASLGMISPVIDGELRRGIMISFKGAHFEKDIILPASGGTWRIR
jgi:hypothetical protein